MEERHLWFSAKMAANHSTLPYYKKANGELVAVTYVSDTAESPIYAKNFGDFVYLGVGKWHHGVATSINGRNFFECESRRQKI